MNLTRRNLIELGGLALGGMTLDQLVAQRQRKPSDTAVILLYLHGGPSHMETYDMKLDAPSSYRSIFGAITTVVPGMDICELLPRHAQVADKFAIVRSLHHTMSSHSDGGIEVLTGKTPRVADPTSQSKSEHPDVGSVASVINGMRGSIPPYISIPRRLYMTRPAYAGAQHAGFEVGDPSSSKNYRPPQLKLQSESASERLANRRQLLRSVDRFRSGLDEVAKGTDAFRQLAFDMLTSPAAAKAFDLTKESDQLRDEYGRNTWGQGCLLARRLAEAGASLITVYINTPLVGQEHTNWDDHIGNAGRPGHFGKYMRVRLPYYDQCVSALIKDIYQRQLQDKIMVVAMGEFGRTPRLSVNSTGTGRNHWPQAYSALVSGGGFKMGQVIGETNSKGEYPAERPLTPKDLLATVYRHLGIDFEESIHDHAGRPIPILPYGEPIRELTG